MAFPSPQSVLFNRSLIYVGGRSSVESVCVVCGVHLIGSITENLRQDEAEHTALCCGRP